MNKKIWIPKLNYYSKRLSMWQEKLWKEVNGKPFMGIIDNIAGRKTFEYATFGRSGVQQSNSKLFTMRPEPIVMPIMQMSTSAMAFVNAAQQGAGGGGSGLTTQIDRNSRTYDADSQDTWKLWGFAGDGNNWHSVSAFGGMTTVTYTDGASTSRTIRSMYDADAGGSPGGGDLFFSIDGASVTDSDATWLDITWDDTAGTPRTMDRSAEFAAAANVNSDTVWRDLTPAYDYTNLLDPADFVLTTS